MTMLFSKRCPRSQGQEIEGGVPGGCGAPEGSDPPEGGCASLPTTLPGGLASGSGSSPRSLLERRVVGLWGKGAKMLFSKNAQGYKVRTGVSSPGRYVFNSP